MDGDCSDNVVRSQRVAASARPEVQATASQLRPTHQRDATRGRAVDEAQPRHRLTGSQLMYGRRSSEDH